MMPKKQPCLDDCHVWRDLVRDLLAAHQDACKEVIIDVELCVMYTNQTWSRTNFIVRHAGFVTNTAFELMKDSLSAYMQKPYYYNGSIIAYYQHVNSCIFCNVKNVVIKDL